jgi:transporter family protein
VDSLVLGRLRSSPMPSSAEAKAIRQHAIAIVASAAANLSNREVLDFTVLGFPSNVCPASKPRSRPNVEAPARVYKRSAGRPRKHQNRGGTNDRCGWYQAAIWAISSAFFAGVTALLAKIGVSGLNSNLATAIRTSVILVFSWAIVFVTSGGVDVHSISRKTWIFLLLSGVATGLSWLCYFRALQIGELSKVAPVDKLSVVMAMAFGALFLHERLTAREGIGGFFIAAGALILAWK